MASNRSGWIKFDCADVGVCIKTDWRTSANRPSSSGGGGSGGGSGVIPPVSPAQIDQCTNIVGDQSTVPSGYALINGLCIAQQIDMYASVSGTQASMASNQNLLNNNSNNNYLVNRNSIQNNQNIPEQSQGNAFDQNGDGEPDIKPEIISPITSIENKEIQNINQDGQYKKVFPQKSDTPQEISCFWCVLIRKDLFPQMVNGEEITTQREIIKYGFVPKKSEIRIPLGTRQVIIEGKEVPVEKGLDGVSLGITFAVILIIRKFLSFILASIAK